MFRFRLGWLVLIFGVAGCAKSPRTVVEAMRESACKGDVAGFYAHVDRKVVEDNFWKDQLQALHSGSDYASMTAEGQQATDKALEELFEKKRREIFEAWTAEMKKGEDNSLCRFSIISATEADNYGEIRIKSPAGADKVWIMSKRADGWVLVNVRLEPVAK